MIFNVTGDIASKAIIGGAIGTGVLLAAPVALPLIDFTAIGPAAGTFAASWMATYAGAVPAAGLYATVQSAAMAGVGLSAAAGTGGVVGAVAGAAAGVVKKFLPKDKEEKSDSSEEGHGATAEDKDGGTVSNLTEILGLEVGTDDHESATLKVTNDEAVEPSSRPYRYVRGESINDDDGDSSSSDVNDEVNDSTSRPYRYVRAIRHTKV